MAPDRGAEDKIVAEARTGRPASTRAIDRASFLAEIIDGKQKIVETLPKLKGGKGE
ncbi:hypothetical protein [Bradyrhizobium sp. CCBAU 11386]|uniref:hypothetical protein n=1 Tax=Bradyrhizobium sp. CCBAU 11386 TaxID=1630837 RepID=UPI002304799D|nr:hypothetical protein [Bradyrhizobium sp. CCBAU 11386]